MGVVRSVEIIVKNNVNALAKIHLSQVTKCKVRVTAWMCIALIDSLSTIWENYVATYSQRMGHPDGDHITPNSQYLEYLKYSVGPEGDGAWTGSLT